jgi:gliding motility-associated-like protein
VVGPVTEGECGFVFNQFSPNGDGTNDLLVINCIELYPNNFLEVYDRYGNKVFAANNYGNTWNGTGNNGNLPKGTYFYILDLGDGSEVRKGWIQSIR